MPKLTLPHNLTTTGSIEFAVAGLAICLIVYLTYKVGWRRDFGLPVRRRIFTRGLHVDRDQVAFVPFWWSDVQVHRSLKAHWRRTMKASFEKPLLSR